MMVRMMPRVVAAVGAAALLAGCSVSEVTAAASVATTAAGRTDRIDWLRSQAPELTSAELDAPAADLAPIMADLRGAKIIGLGEGTHGTAEFNGLRFRVLKRLVATGQVRWIGIEDQVGGVDALNTWLTTGSGSLPAALSGMLTYYQASGYEQFFRWLRAHNRDHPRRQVTIHGTDAQDGTSALRLLTDRYPELATAVAPLRAVAARLDELSGKGFGGGAAAAEYRRRGWTEAYLRKETARLQKAASQQAVVLLAAARRLEDPEAAYVAQTLPQYFAGAMPVVYYWLATNQLAKLNRLLTSGGGAVQQRDRYLAGNLLALAGLRDGAGVYLAHNAHVSKGYSFPGARSSGWYVARKLGGRYVAVMTDFARGQFSAFASNADGSGSDPASGLTAFTIDAPPASSLSAKLEQAGGDYRYLNLRRLRAADPAAVWLFDPLTYRNLGGTYAKDPALQQVVGNQRTGVLPEEFDAVLYVRAATAAEPSAGMQAALRRLQSAR